jgi:hypothetical protein
VDRGACRRRLVRHDQWPDALGYFVGDYAGLDFAPGGTRPGVKPFHVRANDPLDPLNRTDVFATTASTDGP